MEGFILKVVTPEGEAFSGEVKGILLRTTEGDVGILKGHIRYVATLSEGYLKIRFLDGSERLATCMNGFVSVQDDVARIIVKCFEYADEIDVERARAAKEKAEQRIAAHKSDTDVLLAEAKLKRALTRLRVSDGL